jgi:DNA-binding beta-propeller fold protein YncE
MIQRLRVNCGRIVLIIAAAFIFSASVMAHPGSGIAVDRLGQVYFLDTGSGLWKIDAHGRLTQVSRTLFHWLAIDANNRFANTQLTSGAFGEIVRMGADPTLLLSSDYPVAIGQDGNLYYPSGRAGDLRMMRMTPTGATSVLVTLPATVNGTPLPHIGGIIAGPDGSLYYTEDTAIRRIDAQGRVSTVVAVRAPVRPPSIPGMDQHPYLRGLAVDADGVIYVADTGDARVLKITPDGRVTTLLQTQSPWSPTAVALFGSKVYVLEFLHTARDVRRDWLPRVKRIASNGKSSIVATIDQMRGAR